MKNQVKQIRAYLEGIGHPISSVQGYEVLARAHGFKNKHVLAAKKSEFTKTDPEVQRIFELGDSPFSVEEMVALDWSFDVVIPVDPALFGCIDDLNEEASETITGNDCALSDISYEIYPKFYDKDTVAVRVTGYVSDPDYFWEQAGGEDESDALDEFCDEVSGAENGYFRFSMKGVPSCKMKIVYINGSFLGDLEQPDEIAFEFLDPAVQPENSEGFFVHNRDLAKLKKIGDSWEIPDLIEKGKVVRFKFDA